MIGVFGIQVAGIRNAALLDRDAVKSRANISIVQARFARRFLQGIACVALLSPLSAQSAAVVNGNLVRSNSAVVARIESDRFVYHLGDPIRLRLTLTNKSSDQLYIGHSPPPFALVDLQIFDSSGRPLPHGEPHFPPPKGLRAGIGSILSSDLPPGRPVIIDFSDPEMNSRRTEWADVKYWGYAIKKPEAYTLVATPKIEAFGPGDEFNDAPAHESNALRIRVTRGHAGPLLHYAAAPNLACPRPNAEATVTNQVPAQYPSSGSAAFHSPTVEIEVVVGQPGNLVDVRVVKSSGNLSIDQAALRSARQSTFSPKLVNCQPTQGKYLFRAIFQPR